MTDNPWLPIDTMPLSTVGTEVDLIDKRRLYSKITVERVLSDRWGGIGIRYTKASRFGDAAPSPNAKWRPHV
ncbi:hypothetical protein M3G00_07870 [Brevibacterium casei]|uniref:hypothetical protein n=1 Tax=Brevibacterium casei TaxID=33889 RepID=UPI00223B4EAC|nr:hypothetical protein [Brevibacterium casei]MCT2182852.1 hypothetical protein [Brevibacterium casei]